MDLIVTSWDVVETFSPTIPIVMLSIEQWVFWILQLLFDMAKKEYTFKKT